MTRNPDFLELQEVSGTPYVCGEEYGEMFAPRICGFFYQEIKLPNKRKEYAMKCWKCIKRFAPNSADFMEGMARTSKLSIDKLVLLSLHEELVHQKHCSAFVVSQNQVQGGKTVVAQNWDWQTRAYPWPGLLRMKLDSGQSTLTHHYPGLWAACGINEAGLSLMWTGSGYWPTVKPVVGIPTYVLIAEILQLKTVKEVLDYLKKIVYAGSFIFLLGDATGDSCVVEAIPKKFLFRRSSASMCRCNHFVFPKMITGSKQKIPKSRKVTTTLPRHKRLIDLLTNSDQEKITIKMVRNILLDKPIIHSMTPKHMTIDSFYAICEDKTLWT
ncbi:hypothetical protein IIA94_02275, partial [Patescibacteria group bacterium]|nr:hypothetical protein [Patescibacteria group bacterium]